jgi:superfamily II DNA helicase RecQ
VQLRKEFRPAFGKLDAICSIFPDVPIVALTATATKSKKEKIVNSIGLQVPFVVEVNPERGNIFFESRPQPAAKEERVMILTPYMLRS